MTKHKICRSQTLKHYPSQAVDSKLTMRAALFTCTHKDAANNAYNVSNGAHLLAVRFAYVNTAMPVHTQNSQDGSCMLAALCLLIPDILRVLQVTPSAGES